MSRKHFVALAAAIAEIQDPDARLRAAEAVAQVCRSANTAFSFTRFGEACGIDTDRWTFAGAR